MDLIDDDAAVTSHSFDFPTEMCGQLIGQRGRNVAVIKQKSGVEIMIRAKLYNASWQIVTLEGERQFTAFTNDSFYHRTVDLCGNASLTYTAGSERYCTKSKITFQLCTLVQCAHDIVAVHTNCGYSCKESKVSNQFVSNSTG